MSIIKTSIYVSHYPTVLKCIYLDFVVLYELIFVLVIVSMSSVILILVQDLLFIGYSNEEIALFKKMSFELMLFV